MNNELETTVLRDLSLYCDLKGPQLSLAMSLVSLAYQAGIVEGCEQMRATYREAMNEVNAQPRLA